ncbi:MAG TPA: hypothetical protein VF198_02875 [Vicinamibacterales bacterium]
MTFSSFAPAVLLAATVAAPAPQAQRSKDLQEVLNYRLSMTALKQIEAVYTALAAEVQKDPEFRKVRELRREQERLSRKDELTDAEASRLEAIETELEEIEERADEKSPLPDFDESTSLDDLAEQIANVPMLAAALAKAGMKPREFATAQLAFFNTMMAYAFVKDGAIKELPPGVSKENIEFIRTHEAEIEALSRKWETLEP